MIRVYKVSLEGILLTNGWAGLEAPGWLHSHDCLTGALLLGSDWFRLPHSMASGGQTYTALPQEDCKAGKWTHSQFSEVTWSTQIQGEKKYALICDGKVLWSHGQRARGVGYPFGLFRNTVHL